MEKKKNVVIIILVAIIAILSLIIGLLIGRNFADVENENINNIDVEEKLDVTNKEVISENDTIKLNNYNIDSIQNIEIEVPVENSDDPEMKLVTITDKEEIKAILLNVDDAKEVGKIPDEIGFGFPSTITVNYEVDPSTIIIFLNNGNVAINFAVGAGETGYGEYEISNKNFEAELINKYQ